MSYLSNTTSLTSALTFRSLRLQPPPRPSTPISHATPHLVEFPTVVGLGFTFRSQAHRL